MTDLAAGVTGDASRVTDRARPRWVGPLVLLGALLAGGLVGLVGAFLVPLRLGAVPVPASPLIALVGNTLVGLGAARAAGRAGSGAAAVGWLVVVSAASVPGPGGDLVVPATGTAYAFLVVGALASSAVVGLGGLVHDRARSAPRGAVRGSTALGGSAAAGPAAGGAAAGGSAVGGTAAGGSAVGGTAPG